MPAITSDIENDQTSRQRTAMMDQYRQEYAITFLICNQVPNVPIDDDRFVAGWSVRLPETPDSETSNELWSNKNVRSGSVAEKRKKDESRPHALSDRMKRQI